jgi:hypothetical protein
VLISNILKNSYLRIWKLLGLFIFSLIFIFKIISKSNFKNIKEKYTSYVLLQVNDISKISFYKYESLVIKNKPYKTYENRSDIGSFLSKASLNKGMYFKTVRTDKASDNYVVVVSSNIGLNYFFEITKDLDNKTQAIDLFETIDESGLKNLIGRYHFND